MNRHPIAGPSASARASSRPVGTPVALGASAPSAPAPHSGNDALGPATMLVTPRPAPAVADWRATPEARGYGAG